MKAMKVVVFGGSGFIGSHLVAQLAAEGIQVLVPTRRREAAMRLTSLPGVDVVQSDIGRASVEELHALLLGADAAINLVGVLHSARGVPYGEQFRRAHVELPRRIVAACASAGVPRYLHIDRKSVV